MPLKNVHTHKYTHATVERLDVKNKYSVRRVEWF